MNNISKQYALMMLINRCFTICKELQFLQNFVRNRQNSWRPKRGWGFNGYFPRKSSGQPRSALAFVVHPNPGSTIDVPSLDRVTGYREPCMEASK